MSLCQVSLAQIEINIYLPLGADWLITSLFRRPGRASISPDSAEKDRLLCLLLLVIIPHILILEEFRGVILVDTSLLETCGGHLVVTVDSDGCLLVYPLPEWEIIESKLVELSSFDRRAKSIKRLLIGYATECDMDGQGRILLPTTLRDYAGLSKKIIMIGQGKKFEIY